MKYYWIVNLDSMNHLVIYDIATIGNRETVIADGKIVMDGDFTSLFHIHRFEINGKACKLVGLALNNYMPIFINLYIDGKRIPKYKKNMPLPDDINPEFIEKAPPQLFEPTPSWYWLFVIANYGTMLFMRSAYRYSYWFVFLSIISVLFILRNCRSNPYKLNIKQRLFLCIGVTAANYTASILIHYFV